MKLELGTILEPKYDPANIEHVVIKDVHLNGANNEKLYEVETVKSKSVAVLTLEELFNMYEPVGQSDIGKVLFCGYTD